MIESNKLHLENFSERKKITILQDLYATVLTYNFLIAFKLQIDDSIHEKKEKGYKTNINILAGKLKDKFIKIMLTDDKEGKDRLINGIKNFAKRNLVHRWKNPHNPELNP
ncbi:MAG: hypothetical protein LBT66_05370 [Methanobrevibacter sp.]|jgi:hypothetical protein|nr:hypothetical protein [Candidatus Methanovirga meridionalis]